VTPSNLAYHGDSQGSPSTSITEHKHVARRR
jgi:hypothetical protein